VQPDGRWADVVFASAHGVKRTLYAYPEQPIRVRAREIILFRKCAKINRGAEGSEKESGADLDTSSRATWTGLDHDDGAVFMSD
jgi:hypothetical protein